MATFNNVGRPAGAAHEREVSASTSCTTTRSMSRRSLTSTSLVGLRAAAPSSAKDPPAETRAGNPGARQGSSALAVQSTGSGLVRSRSTIGVAGLAKPAGIGKLSSTTAARRRVLAETRGNGSRASMMTPASSTFSKPTSQAPSGKVVGSTASGHRRSALGHGRRMSTAEAAQMKGMGIVRVGPAVTSPPKNQLLAGPDENEPRAWDMGLTFGGPSLDAQLHNRRHTAMDQRTAVIAHEMSPPRRAMDVDERQPFAPSSPFPHALSPRTLVHSQGFLSGAGRKHSQDKDDSSDDDVALGRKEEQYLSPRRKKMRQSEIGEATASTMIRSPPKKTALPRWAMMQSAGPMTQRSTSSASVGMSRSPAMRLHHPSFAGATFGIPTSLPPPPRLDQVAGSQQDHSEEEVTTLAGFHHPPTVPSSRAQLPTELVRRPQAGSHISSIPRPVKSTSTVASKSLQEVEAGAGPATDISMDSSVGVGNRSMSEETVGRLANLQDLLSRLQMRRTSVQGLTGRSQQETPSSVSTQLASSRSRMSLSNLADGTEPVGETRRRASASSTSALPTVIEPQRRSRASLPMTTSVDPALPKERRRHTFSTRPSSCGSSGSGKIVQTGHSAGPLASAMAANRSSAMIRSSSRASTALPSSSSTASIAALAGQCGQSDMNIVARNDVLRGVVAFVDVRTAEGEDSGMVFVDMLRAMGARVITSRPTLTLTHIIFKGGRPGTLQRYRAHPNPKPHLVGIAWVVRCHEMQKLVDESQFAIDIEANSSSNAVVGGTARRRRSMEPRALAPLAVNTSHLSSADRLPEGSKPALHATIAASIERARRKSLQFAPKVGSPLAKRVSVLPNLARDQYDHDDEAYDDDV